MVGLPPNFGSGTIFSDLREVIVSSFRLRRTRNYKAGFLFLKPKIPNLPQCTLLGVKRTSPGLSRMSAFDLQDHGTWTSACETKASIVFTACANSAASPISSETMNTAAIANRPFSIKRRSRSARLRGNVAGEGGVV